MKCDVVRACWWANLDVALFIAEWIHFSSSVHNDKTISIVRKLALLKDWRTCHLSTRNASSTAQTAHSTPPRYLQMRTKRRPISRLPLTSSACASVSVPAIKINTHVIHFISVTNNQRRLLQRNQSIANRQRYSRRII